MNFIPYILQAHNPLIVKALLAHSPIEALHHGIVCGLTWSAEVQLKTSFICPFVHHLADEFAAVIGLPLIATMLFRIRTTS
jgi:hypothetical protein